MSKYIQTEGRHSFQLLPGLCVVSSRAERINPRSDFGLAHLRLSSRVSTAEYLSDLVCDGKRPGLVTLQAGAGLVTCIPSTYHAFLTRVLFTRSHESLGEQPLV